MQPLIEAARSVMLMSTDSLTSKRGRDGTQHGEHQVAEKNFLAGVMGASFSHLMRKMGV
jgi:hypothetical protein